MKKPYQKPQLCVENFLLSEMIASCAYRITVQTTDNCATNISEDILMAGWKELGLFTTGCQDVVQEGQDLIWSGTKLCYHTSQGTSVFSS